MDNKKLGWMLISASAILAIVFIFIIIKINSLDIKSELLSALSYTGIGILFSIFSLGIFLIVFDTNNNSNNNNNNNNNNEHEPNQIEPKNSNFEAMLRALSNNEQKVMRSVRAEPGIEQNTLRLKSDFSKSLLSETLSGLAKKNLIKKISKGKTFKIYLNKPF